MTTMHRTFKRHPLIFQVRYHPETRRWRVQREHKAEEIERTDGGWQDGMWVAWFDDRHAATDYASRLARASGGASVHIVAPGRRARWITVASNGTESTRSTPQASSGVFGFEWPPRQPVELRP
jgi:hypothetical protein